MSSARWQQAAARQQWFPSSSLMMSILCGAGVVGGGYYNVIDLSSYKLLSGRQQCSGSVSAAVLRWRAAWRWCWQRGGGGGRGVAARRRQRGNDSVAVVAVWRQRGGRQHGGGVGSTMAAAGLAAAAEVWRHHSVSSGSRAGGAELPLHAATVAMKTPGAIAMVGTLPTINNQLKAAAAMAMETTTTMTHKT